MKDYRLYSCYICPDVSFTEFKAFLAGLEASVKGATCPLVVAGDFNSKSPEWGSPYEDRRGRTLADLLAALGLAVCNEGNKPTFIRVASESQLGLTLATQARITNITDWTIMDEKSLGLHKYVVFNVSAIRGHQNVEPIKGWAYRKIDYQKLKEKLRCGAPSPPDDVPSACKQAVNWLTKACNLYMPGAGGSTKRRPVFWWNEELVEQRKTSLRGRRLYTRKRKKVGEAGNTAEKEG